MSLNIRPLKPLLVNYPHAKKMEAYRFRFAFRIERVFFSFGVEASNQSENRTPRHCNSVSERQQAWATTTRSLKFFVLYLTSFSSSTSTASFSSPSSSLLIFFSFFLELRSHFIHFWHITNIGYSSQRLEQPRSAIGSWSIRQDYSDTQNLSETASVSKIAIKINQGILF